MNRKFSKLLVANRGEIAIRVMRAASEMGIATVAIYSHEDRFALHRFKADESYQVGEGKKPIAAYLDIEGIVAIALSAGVQAIHPGYGFLSENPEFARACAAAGIEFIGPEPDVMISLGNKVAARNLAISVGVPVMPASGVLPDEVEEAAEIAAEIGYPLMLKASWGGGGRGMRVIASEAEFAVLFSAARREAVAAFGNGEVYLEKLIRRARHIEVQVVGDRHGQHVHLFERDCSVQRRHQKVVECAPAPNIDADLRRDLCEAALRLARAVRYTHAGTVEFLVDEETGKFYFIEVNPRIQVEHTVTEQVTGIDLVKAQIQIAQGARLGTSDCEVPEQERIHLRGFAVQCRVTTEDPERGFAPDNGRLTAYRSAGGFGVRLDGGTAYAGAVITPYYDSLLVKVTSTGTTLSDATARMDRALREFRIRGVTTNLTFLRNVIAHPKFIAGLCTTTFIDTAPELFKFEPRRDRASRLMRFVGDVTVNGNPEVLGRVRPNLPLPIPRSPKSVIGPQPEGTRDLFKSLGADAFSNWILNQQRVLVTDTTMRDAHQSLFATRMRTYDMLQIASHYARRGSGLFSLECWGGATFDVAMRFLKEDPWDRLAKLRESVPNVLLQMLLRGSNAVGYTNYPDNVVKYFVQQAAKTGVDLFRVFDSLNAIDNMRVSIDAVREAGALCEGTICYTADIFDKNRAKYDIKYYVRLARELESAGANILAIKDMAGLCRPSAAAALVKALKEEIGIPIHFHTHDTSGTSAASVLAAVGAGVDIVDAAMDSMSGLTSQPSLGGIVAALDGTERETGLDLESIRDISSYWEQVRASYVAFESDLRAGTSDVYRHEMPGGQYTNLREQARAMGLDGRWADIAQAYSDVNQLFGDIVKVTPTSKVVGDMALFMVASGLTPAEVASPEHETNFPESVVSLFKGELGMPSEGFPAALQRKVLKGAQPLTNRPGSILPAANLEGVRSELAVRIGRAASDTDLASYLMYPKVFLEYAQHSARFGDVSALPTSTFFYGLQEHEEVSITIEPGKTLVLSLQATTNADTQGESKLFFELNGQPRTLRVSSNGVATGRHPSADLENPRHVAAQMPGLVTQLMVKAGDRVEVGDPLIAVEAMKMESTLCCDRSAVVGEVHVRTGMTIEAGALVLEYSE